MPTSIPEELSMRKLTLLLLCLLIMLCGCRSRQETAEIALPTTEATAVETEATPETPEEAAAEDVSETAPAEESIEEEIVPEEEDIPEEWISYEETPETPTRPMEVVEEESSREQLTPEVSEELPEYQPQPNENETPLAIG